MSNLLKIIAFFLLCGSYSFGQAKLKNDELSKDWKLITSSDGVDLFLKKDVCVTAGAKLPFEFTFLKIVNTTNEQKSIAYNYAVYFSEACDGCEPNSERSYTADLAPNSTIEGDCVSTKPGLTGFVKNPNFDGGWHFEGVEIKFLKIK